MSSFAKGNPFLFFFRDLFLGPLVFLFFVFLSPAKVGSLEMQPGAKLQAYLGVIILHLTPARSVLDFESFAGRGQMLDGRVLEASQVEYKPFGKPFYRERAVPVKGQKAHGAVLLQRRIEAVHQVALRAQPRIDALRHTQNSRTSSAESAHTSCPCARSLVSRCSPPCREPSAASVICCRCLAQLAILFLRAQFFFGWRILPDTHVWPGNSFLHGFALKKCYYCRVYMYVRPGVISRFARFFAWHDMNFACFALLNCAWHVPPKPRSFLSGCRAWRKAV